MVLHVSEKVSEKVPNFSWILPGVATWPGFLQSSISSMPLYREYIDSAAEFGWNYVIIGPEWTRWSVISRQIRSLSLYAIMQDPTIGVWVTVDPSQPTTFSGSKAEGWMSNPTIRQQEFQKLASWGVAGVVVCIRFFLLCATSHIPTNT